MEDGVAGVGSRFEIAAEFLDISACADDGGRELLDDSGTIVAYHVKVQGLFRLVPVPELSGDMDGEPVEPLEGFHESLALVFRTLDMEEPREVSGEVSHAGLQPAPVVVGDRGGQLCHQSRPVRTDHGHDEGAHQGRLQFQAGNCVPPVESGFRNYSTITGVPTSAFSKNFRAMSLGMRTHPWEAG